jgi:hypothetical protein
LAFPNQLKHKHAPPFHPHRSIHHEQDTLQRRLAPFTASKGRDQHFANTPASGEFDPRFGFIAMYRDGQRRVLEDAVEALLRV